MCSEPSIIISCRIYFPRSKTDTQAKLFAVSLAGDGFCVLKKTAQIAFFIQDLLKKSSSFFRTVLLGELSLTSWGRQIFVVLHLQPLRSQMHSGSGSEVVQKPSAGCDICWMSPPPRTLTHTAQCSAGTSRGEVQPCFARLCRLVCVIS